MGSGVIGTLGLLVMIGAVAEGHTPTDARSSEMSG